MAVNVDAATQEAMRIGMERAREEGNRLRNELVRRTPRNSARTANAWEVRSVRTGPTTGAVLISNSVRADGINRPVWRLLHEGTGRYGPRGTDIVPVRREALRWPAGGRALSRSSGGYVFATRSRGMRPHPFLWDAVATSRYAVLRNSPPGTPV